MNTTEECNGGRRNQTARTQHDNEISDVDARPVPPSGETKNSWTQHGGTLANRRTWEFCQQSERSQMSNSRRMARSVTFKCRSLPAWAEVKGKSAQASSCETTTFGAGESRRRKKTLARR
jgi:hypothetical protein